MALIRDFKELRTYRLGFDGAMRIFENSKTWPKEERYSLTDQVRRSSRAVCSNMAEGWQKRLYVGTFVSKLSDSNAEAAETLVWLDFAVSCGYLDRHVRAELEKDYRQIIGGLTKMMAEAETWCGPSTLREESGTYHAVNETSSPSANDPA
jgi:four helix bundle protein